MVPLFIRIGFVVFSLLLFQRQIATAVPVAPYLNGSATRMSTGTYPRASLMKDGSLIGSATTFANGNNILSVYHSTDRGSSWNEISYVTSANSASYDVDNTVVIQLPSGRVLAAFRNHDRNGSNNYKYFRITVTGSDDNGVTWKYLSQAAQNPGPAGNGLWEPFMRVAQDGSVQLYYSHENNFSNQVIQMVVSRDEGATWSAPKTVSGANNARDGMPGIASTGGSNLSVVFETGTNGHFVVNSMTSGDDGATWGNRQNVYTSPGGRNAGAPQVVNVGGALVVSFMTDEDNAAGGAWVDNPDFKIVTSGDGGKTWGNKLTFSPTQSWWGGVVDLDGSTFLGLADAGGAKAQLISLE